MSNGFIDYTQGLTIFAIRGSWKLSFTASHVVQGIYYFCRPRSENRTALLRSLPMQVWCNFTHWRFRASRAQLISMTEIHYYVICYAVNDPFVFDIAAALNGLRRDRGSLISARILIDDGTVCANIRGVVLWV